MPRSKQSQPRGNHIQPEEVRAPSGRPFLPLQANAHSSSCPRQPLTPAPGPRAIPGQSHTPHHQYHTPSRAGASPAGLALRPPHLGCDGDTGASHPRSGSERLGHMARCPGLQQGQEGRTLSCKVPPLPWALARASSLSLAAGPGLEPRRGIKPIISRDSGWGGGHQAPRGTPQASQPMCRNSETTHMRGTPNLLFWKLCGPHCHPLRLFPALLQRFSCHHSGRPPPGGPGQEPLCRGSPRCVGLSLRVGGTGREIAQPEEGRGGGAGTRGLPSPLCSHTGARHRGQHD